ncbi:hypothetical protein ASG37_13230 [Sphingomonas sp. Leaf407]|uniref:hypothetical protein n=1 Tax=unclassified Sphingomonas TaxID=196159 RepID=UPI0006F9406E|nr:MULTISPECIES: hypothetical protein [unclassified Sphingomonas]KQN36553.1 hypothetical protein ASE97_12485 [Sphingomonas sp. Leaf42]KQT27174.1 hypothetical protein ASG37_13230 [Sphingomonas sp. Leaf407]
MILYPTIAAAAALLAVPAQQTPPGAGDIPIYDITPPVVATPTPAATPTPRVTPTPRAVPVVRATPVARPAPAPRATAAPEPRAAPVPQPTATPRTVPAVTPPVETAPVPVATEAPAVVATPSPEPVATPEAATSVPASDNAAMPWWVWFLAGIAVAGVVALIATRLRRRPRVETVEDVAPVAPQPVAPPLAAPEPPAPIPAPVAPIAPAPVRAPAVPAAPVVAEPPRGFLEFQLAPLRVGTDADNALLDFDLTVGNPTSIGVEEVRIATLLLTANPRQDDQLAAFFGNTEPRGLDPFALPAGQRRHLEATMALPKAALHVVTSRERPFFVPLMAIDARYRWSDGRISRTTAAFLIGPTLPSGKLAPIFMDKGDRMIDRLEARLHGEVRRT